MIEYTERHVTERTSSLVPEPLPARNPKIETITFDDAAIARVASILQTEMQRADFQLPGSTVWQCTIDGSKGRPMALVTFWPGLNRIDVVSGSTTVVFNRIETVDLVPGVEVQFRGSGKCLILARNGQVIVRS